MSRMDADKKLVRTDVAPLGEWYTVKLLRRHAKRIRRHPFQS